MQLCQIRGVLRLKQSLIVHFSGTPRGTGNGNLQLDFPKDLQAVAQNNFWQIPCSTASQGHARNNNSLMGSVGLIIRCRAGSSVLGVCPSDAGSSLVPNTGHRALGFCKPPTVRTCINSITNRHGCNEWIVTNYDIKGIFFDGTFSVWDSSIMAERNTNWPEIKQAFPGLPVVYFYKRELMEVWPIQQRRNICDFI